MRSRVVFTLTLAPPQCDLDALALQCRAMHIALSCEHGQEKLLSSTPGRVVASGDTRPLSVPNLNRKSYRRPNTVVMTTSWENVLLEFLQLVCEA